MATSVSLLLESHLAVER